MTRLAITATKDLKEKNTMGRKTMIPYGLYRGLGLVNPLLCQQTDMTEDDLSLLWEALQET